MAKDVDVRLKPMTKSGKNAGGRVLLIEGVKESLAEKQEMRGQDEKRLRGVT